MTSSHPLLSPSRWDSLPLVGIGQTAQVRRWRHLVVKVALPGPEARERLKEEVQLNALLVAAGVPVVELLAARRDGRALVRPFVDGQPMSDVTELRGAVLTQTFELSRRLAEVGDERSLRFDLAPANLMLSGGRVVLLDAGRRVAPSVLTAQTEAAFAKQWRALARRGPGKVRLRPFVVPPSGRFHVETPVGTDPRARVLWKNTALASRLGLSWSDAQLELLGRLSTKARPHTMQVATRYVDMIALDRKRGPRGDGRALLLGTFPSGEELSLKGCGPTPLAWKGRAFHEDGLVSFPRALWEVTVADELGRLGFDSPEYLAVFSTSHTTLDNTGRRWPAAAGLRVARTHWRLGHLRQWSHRPEQLKVMLEHVARHVVRPDFDATKPSHVRAFVEQFAKNLGHDVGRTDAMQIHGFNPTPGNVRLDGHFIDYSTVRFLPQYFPDWRFLENFYRVRIYRLVWRRLVAMLVGVLDEGQVSAPALSLALRWFDAAYVDGFFAGLSPFLGLKTTASRPDKRRFVALTQRLRELRRGDDVTFPYWKQTVPGPRFDVLGKAPELLAAIERRHRAPWQVLQVDDEVLPAREAQLAKRWCAALEVVRRSGFPGRRWSEVIRPFLEPERLAALLYGRSTPRAFSEWKRLISTSRHLPEGRHPARRAKRLAEGLGHVVLPGVDARFSERVVGLTPELLEGVHEVLTRVVGRFLVGCVAHGSRVMDRAAVARVDPRSLEGNDLRVRRDEGVREFGPSAALSSDLDLKVFVRGLAAPKRAALELELGHALASLGAWFPFSAHVPPRQRLISTRKPDVRSAFLSWNGAERRRTLGKGPIPVRQAVVVIDGRS
ncbi:MAG: protein adenylyltransferase SelO family protein [Myxococcales bacterium]|nr:protein adenylyltransferase SelO family protein [Myxococcales bacterium]